MFHYFKFCMWGGTFLEIVKNECSDQYHLDIICVPSNIHIYSYNHCTKDTSPVSPATLGRSSLGSWGTSCERGGLLPVLTALRLAPLSLPPPHRVLGRKSGGARETPQGEESRADDASHERRRCPLVQIQHPLGESKEGSKTSLVNTLSSKRIPTS